MGQDILSTILTLQRNEITEYFIYKKLAKQTKDEHNRSILERIAGDEWRHYEYLKSISKRDVRPNRFTILWYTIISRLLGLSFGLKLLEKGEALIAVAYDRLADRHSGALEIKLEEQQHENELLDMLEEERLEYAGSMVLGLNDALVELTGALVGFTLALRSAKLVAILGIISGIAAALSMAASGYLQSREEADASGGKNPAKSALYTGVAYIVTVTILIIPYLLFENVYMALALMLLADILIIAGYTFYITTAKSLGFRHRFFEMALISLGVACTTFGIGWAVRHFFNIDL
ncbi:MAG: rubrerythrin family protein [Candidatus Latescibacteria bacterium]|nr:rubrerythrin family protein [Candidatus Latescibacterota bacterium]NIM22499.1 rubrerythrin family protein [Candidatus Latescibacterota bacterium]NIM64813.1 rubrerythrin family protein [Candidatus Latescibacterota bacterium]NIO01321.1 rubrerythrin family protein [Candidatus Latescibacterota bacterium]NIO27810.1 rubrerythrin family protein [Candidatus Latescibacterota bacterium]